MIIIIYICIYIHTYPTLLGTQWLDPFPFLGAANMAPVHPARQCLRCADRSSKRRFEKGLGNFDWFCWENMGKYGTIWENMGKSEPEGLCLDHHLIGVSAFDFPLIQRDLELDPNILLFTTCWWPESTVAIRYAPLSLMVLRNLVHRSPFPIGWLTNRGGCWPLEQQVNDDWWYTSHRPTPKDIIVWSPVKTTSSFFMEFLVWLPHDFPWFSSWFQGPG